MTTAAALADDLGVSEGDVLVVLDGSAPADAIPRTWPWRWRCCLIRMGADGRQDGRREPT